MHLYELGILSYRLWFSFMLKTILTFLLLLLQCLSYAQDWTPCYTEMSQLTTQEVFTKVPDYPHFMHGEKGWINFVARNFSQDSLYRLLRDKSILRDSVVVQFIVRREGGISNLQAITGVYESTKVEALRLLKLSCPYWVPANQSSGVRVSAWFRQIFIFEVNEEEGKVELIVRLSHKSTF